MTDEQRQTVAEWQTSGQPMQPWCREKGIPYTTFSNWRKRAGFSEAVKCSGDSQLEAKAILELEPAEEEVPAARVQWAGVKPETRIKTDNKDKRRSAAIVLRYRGWRIEVHAGADKAALAEVVRAVSAAC